MRKTLSLAVALAGMIHSTLSQTLSQNCQTTFDFLYPSYSSLLLSFSAHLLGRLPKYQSICFHHGWRRWAVGAQSPTPASYSQSTPSS